MRGACARAEGVIARAIKIRHTAGDPSIVSRKPLAGRIRQKRPDKIVR